MDELQKLYDVVSTKFDVGSFDEFSSKMQDVGSRQRFYNTVTEKGFDIGDYDEYEQRLSTGKPKGAEAEGIGGSVSPSASTDSSSESKATTETGFTPTETSKDELLSKLTKMDLSEQYEQQAISNLREHYDRAGGTNYHISDEEIKKEVGRITDTERLQSLADTVNKINSTEDPKKQRGYWSNLLDNLELGSVELGKIIASIPEGLYDIGAIPQNAFSQLTGIDITASSTKFKKDFDITNPILDYYIEESQELQKTVAEFNEANYESSSIYDNIAAGNYQDAFELLGSGLAQSAPVSVSMMLGGAATSIPKLAGYGTIAMTGEKRMEVEESHPELSELGKTINALGLAGAETVFEAVGSGSLGRVYKDIIMKEGVEQGSKVFKNGLIEMYQGALKKYGAVPAALGEGVEEVATTITQNMINNKPVFEGVADSFIQGVGGGALYGSPLSIRNTAILIEKGYTDRQINKIIEAETNDYTNITDAFSPKARKKVTTDKIELIGKKGAYEKLEKELDKAVKQGKIGESEVESYKKDFLDTSLTLSKTEGVELTPENRAEAVNLIKEKEKLAQEVKNMDDVLAEGKKKRIETINGRLQELTTRPKTATLEETKAQLKPYTSKEVTEIDDASLFVAQQAKAMAQRTSDKLQVDVLTEKQAQEILDEGGKLFMTNDGKAGGYVKADGYMGGLFKDPTAGRSEAAKVLQQARIKTGGKFFDAYGTHLEDIYIENGFRPVARLPFDENLAPKGWKKTNLKSRPDVVFFAYSPESNNIKGSGQMMESYQDAYELAKNYKPVSEITSKKALTKSLDKGTWAIVTAENPQGKRASKEQNEKNNTRAKKWLEEKGYQTQDVKGQYNKNKENSFYVPDMTRQDTIEFAKEFDQESVATSDGLISQDGSFYPKVGASSIGRTYDDNYSTIETVEGSINFQVQYDFENKVEVGKAPKPKIKAETQKLADNIRKLKVTSSNKKAMSKLKVAPTALFELAWDGALETVATTIELTGNFAQAMYDGVQHLRNSEWYLKLSEKGRAKAERMFREDINRQYDGDKVNQSWNDSMKASIDKMKTSTIQKLVDKYYIVRKAIRENFSVADDKYNFSQAEINMHGKAANDIDKFDKTLEGIIKEISDKKLTVQNVSDYLYAKHAEERNRYIKENIDPENEFGSGMTPQEADRILNKTFTEDQKADLESLSQKFYDILAGTRTIMLEHGLITEEQYDTLSNFYENYVPLQGFENQDIAANNQIQGKKLDIAGHLLERSSGRSTRADNVIANIVASRVSAIIKARKNEVLQTLYHLGVQSPNNGVFSLYTNETLPKTVKVDKSGSKIEQKEDARSREDYVGVKVDGEQYWVKFRNAELGRVLNASNIEKSNIITRALRSLNRYLSVTLTTLNPEFVISNFSRDIQTAVLNVMAESDINPKFKSQNIAKSVVKDTGKAIKAIMVNERFGKVDTEMQKYYEEFKEDGAKTGWANQADIATIKKRMETMVKHFDAKGITAHSATAKLKAVGKFVNDVNTAVENGVRLSAYINARKAGLTRDQSARIAKELTVNFNKSGEYGTVLNSMYLFFNASIQGNVRFIKAMTTLKKTVREDGSTKYSLNRGQKLALGLTTFASMLTLLNQAMSDDDEDGMSFYQKIPDFEKERNLIFMNPMNGKDYFKIPLPYGYNIFHNFGTIAAEVSTGQREVGDGIGFLTSAAVGAFSPVSFGGGKSDVQDAIVNAFTPTIAKPIVDLARNEDYFGSQIYNENFPVGTPKPDASMGRRTTPETFKEISIFLNSLSGGNEYESGNIDLSPESMYYIYKFAIGGTGKFLQNVGETAFTAADIVSGEDKKLEVRKTPFARKVYGEPNKYVDQTTFFDNYDEIRQKLEAVKAKVASEKDMDNKRNIAVVEESYKKSAGLLKDIRKQKRAAEQILDPIERTERLNKLDDRYYDIIKKANGVYNEKIKQE